MLLALAAACLLDGLLSSARSLSRVCVCMDGCMCVCEWMVEVAVSTCSVRLQQLTSD